MICLSSKGIYLNDFLILFFLSIPNTCQIKLWGSYCFFQVFVDLLDILFDEESDIYFELLRNKVVIVSPYNHVCHLYNFMWMCCTYWITCKTINHIVILKLTCGCMLNLSANYHANQLSVLCYFLHYPLQYTYMHYL